MPCQVTLPRLEHIRVFYPYLSATSRTTRGIRGSRTKNKLARPPSSCHSVEHVFQSHKLGFFTKRCNGQRRQHERERQMKAAVLLTAQGNESPKHPAGYVGGLSIVLHGPIYHPCPGPFCSFFTSIVSNESHTGPLCFLPLRYGVARRPAGKAVQDRKGVSAAAVLLHIMIARPAPISSSGLGSVDSLSGTGAGLQPASRQCSVQIWVHLEPPVHF